MCFPSLAADNMSGIALLICCLSFLAVGSLANTVPHLKLVQVLSRHGARTPLTVWDSDPHKDFWVKQGLGQLTNEGKKQHLELGQLLRKKFEKFLNTEYVPSQVLVNSTNKDRTLMSGLSNLAGLYPPVGNQVWNDKLGWQPIPIHTKPKQVDYFLDTDSTCPRWSQLYAEAQQTPGMKAIDTENAELYKKSQNETGYEVTGIFTLNDVYDTFHIEHGLNMSIPSWVTPAIYQQLDNLTNVVFSWKFHNKEMLRLKGGPILKQMLNYINDTISGHNKDSQLYMYFAHDFLLAAVLMELGVFDNIAPPFASSILLELYATSATDHAVKWSYRNATAVGSGADYHPLTIPNCERPAGMDHTLCPLDKFTQLMSDYIPGDIVKECQVSLDSIQKSLENNW